MNIFFAGAGGAGMGALVRWHGQLGSATFVQDDAASPAELLLKYPEAQIFDAGVDIKFDRAVFSDAIPAGHPLRRYALEKNIPVRSYAEELGALSENRHVIAVAGTHGKSTTTALISWALALAGKPRSCYFSSGEITNRFSDPLCVIGAEIKEWHGGFRFGEGPVVVEADEYKKHFLHLRPSVIVITSLEMDHFDTYADEGDLVRTFVGFCSQASVESVFIARDGRATDLLSGELGKLGKKVIRFGGKQDLVRCVQSTVVNGRCRVQVSLGGKDQDFEMQAVTCAHVSNLLGAVAVLANEKLPIESLRQGISSFPGILRRLELLGTIGDAPLYSDYAHHPTAVRETLHVLKKIFPDSRIAVIFEPHERLRTSALCDEYQKSFADADAVGLLPIYDPIGRERPDISDSASAISLSGDFTILPDYPAAFAWAEKFAEKIEPTHSRIIEDMSMSDAEKKRLIVIMGAGPIDGAFRRYVANGI